VKRFLLGFSSCLLVVVAAMVVLWWYIRSESGQSWHYEMTVAGINLADGTKLIFASSAPMKEALADSDFGFLLTVSPQGEPLGGIPIPRPLLAAKTHILESNGDRTFVQYYSIDTETPWMSYSVGSDGFVVHTAAGESPKDLDLHQA